jgi:hypothetical protein
MNKGKMTFIKGIVLACLLLLGGTSGCGAAQLDPISQTLTPLSASVRGTATARAGSGGVEDALQTAIAVATQRSQVVYATQTANAALNEPARLATVTAMAPVVAELPRYSIDISDGYVAWMHNPVTINLQGYMTNGYKNDYPLITAADFVIAADIKMDSIGSMSGCGFMFRSNGDPKEPDQYSVLITRVATGYLAFMATAKGNIANFSYYFPKSVDKSFNWFNNETNRLAVVARGDLIDMYTNGHLIAEVDTTLPPPNQVPSLPTIQLPPGATAQQQQDFQNMNAQYDDAFKMINSQLAKARSNFLAGHAVYSDGMLGFIAFNQSGTMTCTFENAWLFILNR